MLTGVDPHALLVFGSGVAIVLIVTIGTIIKAWIKKDSGSNITENREFLAALREFKENMERRVSNLEAIVGDQRQSAGVKSKQEQQKPAQKSLLDIEIDTEPGESGSGQKAKLKNMLNQ
ncbi:MAG: hypothetical protein EA359_07970 [Balneolaceae bacterium]|nr:MAG: hypothetical protein EA359_07970 [Balneolaceae bacterium]